MNRLVKNLRIIRFMILEEFRMNASMIGKVQFLFFPFIIGVFAFIFSVSSVVILQTVSMEKIYFILHAVILAYGLGVGGFGLFGEHIAERRFGRINLLLTTPMTQPIGFRSTFLTFYVKDIIYYLLFSIFPLVAGIGFSIPLTGFRIASVLFLLLTLTLAFLLGISFSFFLSTIYVRSRIAFAFVAVILASAVIGSFATDFYSFENLIPTLMYQYTMDPIYLGAILASIVVFSAIAVNFIKVRFGKRAERYRAEVIQTKEKFAFAGGYSAFAAKEWLDMKRNGTLYPVMGAYFGPLIFLVFIHWFLNTLLALPIDFNVIFYAAMLGLFSLTIYSWLNITDVDLYELLPVTVPKLIRTKLLLFAMFTSAISITFLVILSLLNSDVHLLWLALIVALTLTLYVVSVTAYLTGLRTNVYLFNAVVLAKFTGLIATPLIIIIIASFVMTDFTFLSLSIMGILCAVLVIASVLLYRNLDKRWGRESFIT